MLMTKIRTLVDRLPPVRGEYVENFNLGRIMWFKVGGPAEIVFTPADLADLRHFLTETPRDIPVTVIGAGSNLLVRDGGVPGVVIRLGGAFSNIEFEDDVAHVGAAALNITVARAAAREKQSGLAFLSGIPGAIGGALRMNAGAYGTEIKDVLIRARAVDRAGTLHETTPDALGYSYRHCNAPEDWIFISAELRVHLGATEEIAAQMADIATARGESQPIRTRTGGSTFKNPPNLKAWELVDAAGCRGLVRGGAQVSEQHCNFLINTGDATAADLEGLGEEVRRRVQRSSGVALEWEIQRLGSKDPREARHG
jgi:UDP-N-acetylmuramate dehydrogenase